MSSMQSHIDIKMKGVYADVCVKDKLSEKNNGLEKITAFCKNKKEGPEIFGRKRNVLFLCIFCPQKIVFLVQQNHINMPLKKLKTFQRRFLKLPVSPHLNLKLHMFVVCTLFSSNLSHC